MTGVDDAVVIAQCLLAAADGPFFPNWEFHTLFGFERDELRRIAAMWPKWSDVGEQDNAVNATMNNLLCYPHHRQDAWRDYVSCTPRDVAAVYTRWRGEEAFDEAARGYFDRLT